MRKSPGDQVGEDGFDDGVPAVGDVGDSGGFEAVGEERVAPQSGNSSSSLARSRTRRTISRAVTGWLGESNAQSSRWL